MSVIDVFTNLERMIAARFIHQIHISVLGILQLLLLQLYWRESDLGGVSSQRNPQPSSEKPSELSAQYHVHSLLGSITHSSIIDEGWGGLNSPEY